VEEEEEEEEGEMGVEGRWMERQLGSRNSRITSQRYH
jgi:hypothetical protein